MTYASIMVAVDPEEESRRRVRVAAHLADRFGAGLIGVAAERPDYAAFSADPGAGGPFVLPVLDELCLDRLRQAHALFAQAAALGSRMAWRSDIEDPLSFLLAQAVAADLVVLGRPLRDTPAGRFAIAPDGAVMALGRPVLLVPAPVEHLEASRVAIGWKNTREARRAVADAMPFLARAAQVVVCSVSDGGEPGGAQDLVRTLAARGIPATAARTAADGAGTAEALIDMACEHAADLLVIGAYGHSRLREWTFGGVTRDLLRHSPICCLMSH
ncbi:universal stress protein [Methylobacterium sp. J-076]|uniref:universal stress protein n=1 Tax=Methylobacterium sp. J-076 TaxID=2836655 RepID=UPI001FBA69AD|nr:universal stress protein [Methylobacterium sp. J-076]MCJ2012798.1 universal stress protein [Methylobacterium sp. J-076]